MGEVFKLIVKNKMLKQILKKLYLPLLISVLLHSSTVFAQGNGCDEGVIRLPDRSGTIQICSALATQVPQLAKQLAAASKTLGNQDAQLKELTRLIKGLNGVSAGIGIDRQAQMLKTLSTDLGRAQEKGNDRTKLIVESLSNQVEELRDQMLTALSSNKTANATNEALKGTLGDAIAKLEFGSASRQMDDIAKKLTVIQSDVSDIKSTTENIQRHLLKAESERIQQKQSDEKFLADRQRESDEYIASIKKKSDEDELVREAKANATGRVESLSLDLSLEEPGDLGPKAITAMQIFAMVKDRNWDKALLDAVFQPQTADAKYYDLSKKIKRDNAMQRLEFEINYNPVGTWAICVSTLDQDKKRLRTAVKLFKITQIKSSFSRMFRVKNLADDLEVFEVNDPKNPCIAATH